MNYFLLDLSDNIYLPESIKKFATGELAIVCIGYLGHMLLDLSTLKAGFESLKARVLGKEGKLEEAEVSYEAVPIVDRVKTGSESIAVDVEKKDDKPEEAVLEVSQTNSYF